MPRTPKPDKSIETLRHGDARRPNIPSAEHESVMSDAQKTPIQVAYERRNRDLDPQLVWRGKDVTDWSNLVVPAPPRVIPRRRAVPRARLAPPADTRVGDRDPEVVIE